MHRHFLVFSVGGQRIEPILRIVACFETNFRGTTGKTQQEPPLGQRMDHPQIFTQHWRNKHQRVGAPPQLHQPGIAPPLGESFDLISLHILHDEGRANLTPPGRLGMVDPDRSFDGLPLLADSRQGIPCAMVQRKCGS